MTSHTSFWAVQDSESESESEFTSSSEDGYDSPTPSPRGLSHIRGNSRSQRRTKSITAIMMESDEDAAADTDADEEKVATDSTETTAPQSKSAAAAEAKRKKQIRHMKKVTIGQNLIESLSLPTELPLPDDEQKADETTATTKTGTPTTASTATPTTSIPSSRSSTSTNSSSGDKLTFANSLTHNFEHVCTQVEVGLFTAKRTASLLKKLCALEEEYAKCIVKVLAGEQNKMNRVPDNRKDRMASCSAALQTVHELFENSAKEHSSHAQKLMMEVVVPLMEFHESGDAAREEWLRTERTCSGEMARCREEVLRGEGNCTKLLTAAKASSAADARQDPKMGKSLLSSLKTRFGKSTKTVSAEAARSALSYQQSINAANSRQQRYLQTDLPRIFAGMEALENHRIKTLQQRLSTLSTITQQSFAEQGNIAHQLQNTVNTINSDEDLTRYIKSWLDEHGPPNPSRPYEYQLPYTPKEIEEGQWESNPRSVFHCKLEEVMELQHETHPKAQIPLVVSSTIEAIRRLGGATTEGIFRISAAKSELDALHKQIDSGNYDIQSTTPHVPAALLKEWLRLLEEPPIPQQLYAEAISGVRGKDADPDAIYRIFQQLPAINQHVLEAIVDLASEISSEANCKVTRMSLENLAIVFAPGLLRNPSDDPLVLLENTKYETKFTAALFRVISQRRKGQSVATTSK